MSSEALTWAFKVNLKPSALKFTLVAMCECANFSNGKIYPSIARLVEMTGQDRKTIIANIGRLEALGLVTDTGERAGHTGQIKVYQAAVGSVPKTEPFEASQKRDTIPKTEPLNSTVFPCKESQKRYTEPSREPSTPSIPNGIGSPTPDLDDFSTEAPLTEAEVVDAWNVLADQHGLAKVKILTDGRRKQLRSRLRQHSLDDFTEAIAAISRSPWLRGENDRGWRADFDFFLQPKSFTKLIEGAYDH